MIRVLSLARPLVVSDVDAFRELPDAVALKVPVDEREVDTLAAALELLSSRADLWAQMSEAARAYAAREHDVDRAADLYAEALAAAAR
jgi:glycosyltransferase involved in cell wall biosynthesis